MVKIKVLEIFQKQVEKKAAELPFQVEVLSLLAQEKQDIAWQSTIYRIPWEVMSFSSRACTKTLTTPDNLRRWGHKVDPKCNLQECGITCTLGHLSMCDKSLDRFKYRHDGVLAHILKRVMENKPEGREIFCYLKGWKCNGSTVLSDLALTRQVPDIVLLERRARRVVILELPCSFDTEKGINDDMERKQERYRLLENIHMKGYTVLNMPLEVGTRGFINTRNFGVLTNLSAICKIKDLKNFRQNLGRISLLGSYRIWLARHSQEWAPGDLIE